MLTITLSDLLASCLGIGELRDLAWLEDYAAPDESIDARMGLAMHEASFEFFYSHPLNYRADSPQRTDTFTYEYSWWNTCAVALGRLYPEYRDRIAADAEFADWADDDDIGVTRRPSPSLSPSEPVIYTTPEGVEIPF
jgi:hypothetical protein